MNELKLYEAINLIDEDLILEAAKPENKTDRSESRRRCFCAVGSAAAAAAVAVGAAFLSESKNPPVTSGDYSNNESVSREDNISSENVFSQSTVSGGDTQSVSSSYNTSSAPVEHKGGVEADGAFYQAFAATRDPNSDAYGEDEFPHVEITTAYGTYRQIDANEDSEFNIGSNIEISDFGGYIGKVVETDDSRYHGNDAESQEPNLAGADVYYYAPAGKSKAVLIVKKGRQCSIFVDDRTDLSGGFMNGLSFFDVKSAADIESVSYEIHVPVEGGRMEISSRGTISDSDTINELFKLLSELEPEDYSKLPPHIGTPQWLEDAWEAYDADPSARAREDISFSFRLKNGFVIDPIEYQPYIGNGYVHHMQELTPGQNKALRAFFSE